MHLKKRPLGSTGFQATVLGIGDLADRSVPLEKCVATIHRAICDLRYVEEILPLARQKGVGTVCFKTFGAGKLLGDTTGYNRPLETRPRGKFSSGGKETGSKPVLPRLTVAECLHYTFTINPDVALLGLSFPNEQDAAFKALGSFQPLASQQLEDIRRRAIEAIEGKGPCWWNPPS